MESTLSTPYESATLLIRLYELRREPKMRDARDVVCGEVRRDDR